MSNNETPTPAPADRENKLTFRQSLLVIFGFLIAISVVLTALGSIFSKKIPVAAKERYDNCMAARMKLNNLGVIEVDSQCDYLKRS